MLPVQTMSYEPILIYLIQDPVGVVRHRRRKNDKLIMLGELFQKFVAARPYHVKTFIIGLVLLSLLEMYQSLI